MPELNNALAAGLETRYRKLGSVVQELASGLSEGEFWTKPFPFGNSFGHLMLHLTGNLNYYIGARIAGTGYVRDRPREFAETARPTKDEVTKNFQRAIDLVVATIRSQSPEDWSKQYTATGSDAKDRFEMVLQCGTHLHHHIGQMIYLKFALTGTSHS